MELKRRIGKCIYSRRIRCDNGKYCGNGQYHLYDARRLPYNSCGHHQPAAFIDNRNYPFLCQRYHYPKQYACRWYMEQQQHGHRYCGPLYGYHKRWRHFRRYRLHHLYTTGNGLYPGNECERTGYIAHIGYAFSMPGWYDHIEQRPGKRYMDEWSHGRGHSICDRRCSGRSYSRHSRGDIHRKLGMLV